MRRELAQGILHNLADLQGYLVGVTVPVDDIDYARFTGLMSDVETRISQFRKAVGRETKDVLQARIAELQAELAILQAELDAP